MPKFLENRLLAAAHARGLTGKAAKRYEFGTMNNIGAMHGNKETAKGREMEAKHERDTMKTAHEPMREMRIEIHRDKAKKVTGYTVHHDMVPKPSKKSQAFYEDTRVSHPFAADDHESMAKHVADHLAGQATATYAEGDRGGDKAKEAAEDAAYDGE